MKLRDKINADLTAAMKAKEAARLSVLRMMKAAVKNREVELRAELDDSAALQVLSTLINQRRAARAGRSGSRGDSGDRGVHAGRRSRRRDRRGRGGGRARHGRLVSQG